MDTIGQQKIWSLLDSEDAARTVTCNQVRRGPGHSVPDYFVLAMKIAELQFRNPGYVLLFRGQTSDYSNKKGNSSLKPTLFRSIEGENPSSEQLRVKFERLDFAERRLLEEFDRKKVLGRDRLAKHRMLRWAVLQHYEVCDTPLLDVTHSLRIVASFGSLTPNHESYVFVLGVPNLAGAVTASAEDNLQIIRLSSVCPPFAVRPHIQEGYLLGEYPELSAYDQKKLYRHHEIDFGRRLVAKFRFDPSSFWRHDQFPKVLRPALYPGESNDPLNAMARELKNDISQMIQ